MSQPSPQQDDERLSAEAAHWCSRLHDGDCSDEEREAFRRWCAQDPRHREEYEAMLHIWQLADALPAPRQPARAARRPRARQLAKVASVAVIALAGVWGGGWSAGWLPSRIAYYSAAEGHRTLHLADDSSVVLNAHSRLFFAAYRDRREVHLGSNGEAYFEVSHDSRRPFTVDTDNGRVRVTGTRFNVWTDPRQLRVTLLQGSVVVSPPPGMGSESAHLTPGMQALYQRDARQIELSQVAATDAIAWVDGRLVLADMPLSAAVPLINRYLPYALQVNDPAVAAMSVGGIYDTGDLQALVDSLPKVLPVDLRKRRDGSVTLVSRYASL